MSRMSGKCAGYYYIDTSENGNVEELSVINNISQKKRKEFFEKISQIFMYQMEIQNKDSLKWRIIHKELKKMI